MYFRDHPPPHFHAKFAEHVAEIEIEIATLTVSDGSLPPAASSSSSSGLPSTRRSFRRAGTVPARTKNWSRSTGRRSILVMVAVTAVEPLAHSTLRLAFDDGSERVVDLADELWGPMGELLRDPAYFHQVRVDPELRTVVWPNGFDLDPDVLHGRQTQNSPPAATRQSAA